MIQDRIAIDSY